MGDINTDRRSDFDLSRRTAMRKIVVGVGVIAGISVLPERWTTPVIGKIVLPGHAATSGSTLHDPCEVEIRGGDSTTDSVIIKVTGFVTPPVANLPVKVTATAAGGNDSQVNMQSITLTDGTFEVFLTLDGGPGINEVNVETTVSGADGTARCSVSTSSVQPVVQQACSMAAGEMAINAGPGVSVNWPGGPGPHVLNAQYIIGSNCWMIERGVFAESQSAALEALGVTGFGSGGMFDTDRDNDSCSFFAIANPCPST